MGSKDAGSTLCKLVGSDLGTYLDQVASCKLPPQWDVDSFQHEDALSTKERSVPRSSTCQNRRSKETARHETTFPIRNANLAQRHLSVNLALTPRTERCWQDCGDSGHGRALLRCKVSQHDRNTPTNTAERAVASTAKLHPPSPTRAQARSSSSAATKPISQKQKAPWRQTPRAAPFMPLVSPTRRRSWTLLLRWGPGISWFSVLRSCRAPPWSPNRLWRIGGKALK